MIRQKSALNEDKYLFKKDLGTDKYGGGGIRTPVPRCFKISVYMLSRLFDFRLTQRQTTGSQLGYFGAFSLKSARTTDSASLLFDALT